MNHQQKKFVEIVLRRMTYLSERIASSRGNSFDESELAALTWLLNEKEAEYYGNSQEESNSDK